MDTPTPRDALDTGRFFPQAGSPPVEWIVIDGTVEYADAVVLMEERVAAVSEGMAPEAVFLLEHPPLYTAGTSAEAGDLLDAGRFPVFRTGRGGEYTYHGPGQRVAYVVLDLKRRRQDVRAFVAALEAWVIATLAEFQIRGERREDRVGVWVRRPERPSLPGGATAEDKIAAIGIRLRKWVTFHGISLNVDPDLTHFDGIVPCGIRGYGVTSLLDLGIVVSMPEVDGVMRREFETVFGPTAVSPAAGKAA
ncbi:lipoyl(octanoyl) transferase LipB [Aureimonas sp. SK2]|uniref:lipoyl(octanoyl) transferase LipB n=1 Tax=Aureimonas sp. SK2 TaxID=3015992 RepID=UPI0024441BCD|nr:lipoyl(octanoyl) transferase LipB [Aureimonas sp. SK2]